MLLIVFVSFWQVTTILALHLMGVATNKLDICHAYCLLNLLEFSYITSRMWCHSWVKISIGIFFIMKMWCHRGNFKLLLNLFIIIFSLLFFSILLMTCNCASFGKKGHSLLQCPRQLQWLQFLGHHKVFWQWPFGLFT
jgi:hypothetical protein